MPDADERAALHSTFIKGVHVRMHIGTVCRFGGYDWCCFNAPRCKVLGFDNEESKWRVQLENVNMELLVPEWSLRLGYCLLPSSLNAHTAHVQWAVEENPFPRRPHDTTKKGTVSRDEQFAGGCGLIAQQAVKKDALLFEDRPFAVIPSPTAGLERWHESWLAYEAMAAMADTEPLIAFSSLDFGSSNSPFVRHGIQHTCSKLGGAASKDVRSQMKGALGRFQTNAFSFPHNLMDSDKDAQAAMSASAIYAFMSRINHSCDANCAVDSKEHYCSERGLPFDAEKDSDTIVCFARRDISADEEIAICYYEVEFPSSTGVKERRAFLREWAGFDCACKRCCEELGY